LTDLPQPRTGVVEHDGAKLTYDSVGARPALVLLHAGIADRRMWDAQLPALATRCRVIRYDLRGFGDSPMPPGPFSHRRDLAALLDHCGLERAALIGASYGGRVATEFALEQPARVAALVTVGAPLGGLAMSSVLDEAEAQIEAAVEAGDLDRAAEIDVRVWVDGPQRQPSEVEPTFRARAHALARHVYEVMLAGSPEGGPPAPLTPSAVQRLEQLAAPTLVVVGALDQPDILRAAEQLAQRIPNARHALLPDTAHLPSLEQPTAFNALVLDFLAEAPCAASTLPDLTHCA
jgi:pimeloyl-ACP methyl ester carboxylesterase